LLTVIVMVSHLQFFDLLLAVPGRFGEMPGEA
jgi:hypothetical protein